MSLGTAAVKRSEASIQWPWFILLFSFAAVLNTYVPSGQHVFAGLSAAGKLGLAATLFLIGASLSPKRLKSVGLRPLLQGVLLWLVVATLTLLCIRWDWIRI